jgi:hypothetical protein
VRKVLEQDIRWRGSVTDLATDCAHLLTEEQGLELARELLRFLGRPSLTKYKASGYEYV